MRVEKSETIRVGSSSDSRNLEGVALMAKAFEERGETFHISFNMVSQAIEFEAIFAVHFGGKCDVRGKIVFIKGRE